MKKILLIILILLITSFAQADQCKMLASMNPYIAGSVAAAASACNPANNEVGDRTEESTNFSISADTVRCFLSTSDCSGDLDTAYLYDQEYTAGTYAKICIYSDDGDSTPDSGDLKIGCSGEIASATANGWKSSAADGGSVTSAAAYWVCVAAKVGNTDTWDGKRNTSISNYYKTSSGFYAAPPDNLDGSWNTEASAGPLSAYVSVK